MNNDELRRHIDQLHKELEYASETDHHVKDMFGSLMTDIVVGATKPSDDDLKALQDILGEQKPNFESRHPRLAQAMQHIMDMLAKMGI